MKISWGLMLLSIAAAASAKAADSKPESKRITFASYVSDNFRVLSQRKKTARQVAFQEQPDRMISSQESTQYPQNNSGPPPNGGNAGFNSAPSLWKNGSSVFGGGTGAPNNGANAGQSGIGTQPTGETQPTPPPQAPTTPVPASGETDSP